MKLTEENQKDHIQIDDIVLCQSGRGKLEESVTYF